MAGGGLRCLKWFLIISNTIAILVGLGSLGLGIYTKVNGSRVHKHRYAVVMGPEANSEQSSLNIGTFFLAVGAIVTAIGLLGCCGALLEKRMVLVAYSVVLFTLFITQLAAGLYAFHIADVIQGSESIQSGMYSTFKQSLSEPEHTQIAEAWGSVQTDLTCCGVVGAFDYSSAGVDPGDYCGSGFESQPGCYGEITNALHGAWTFFAVFIIAAAVFELLSFGSTCGLCCGLRTKGDGYKSIN